MRNEYVHPSCEFVSFESADVIATSLCITDGCEYSCYSEGTGYSCDSGSMTCPTNTGNP